MMGGVRRWYDIVTAQIAGLTTSMAGKMPVTGGGFSGPITATAIHSESTLSAATDIYSGGNLTASGAITLGGNLSSSGTVSGANVTSSGTVSGANVTSSGAVTASGTVSGGALGTTGSLNVQGGATINGSVTTGYLEASSLHVPNVATVGEIACTGNISAAGWINCAEYRLFGVPVVMLAEEDFAALEARLDALERRSALESA